MSEPKRRFNRGQRVRMTALGYERLCRFSKTRKGSVTTGFVYSRPRNPLSVTVVRDGHASPTSYHADFWEPVK